MQDKLTRQKSHNNVVKAKEHYRLDQWSSRCTLVHTSVHENYFRVNEICRGVHEIKLESYTTNF